VESERVNAPVGISERGRGVSDIADTVSSALLSKHGSGPIPTEGDVEDDAVGSEFFPRASRSQLEVSVGHTPVAGVRIAAKDVPRDGVTWEKPHTNRVVRSLHCVHASTIVVEVVTVHVGLIALDTTTGVARSCHVTVTLDGGSGLPLVA